MRLENYLFEYRHETRSERLEKDEAISLLKKNCHYDLKKFKLYRGSSPEDKTLLIEPAKYERSSANTENYYTILFDNLPEWKRYPKRSKSIICTTDTSYADNFGTIYRVFPYDNAKIGICPTNDLWGSFERYMGDYTLADFNYYLEKFAKTIGLDNKMNTYPDLIKLFDAIDNNKEWVIENLSPSYSPPPFLDDYLKRKYSLSTSLLSFVENAFDPENNGFKLVTPKTFGNPDDKEVWTDSPSILIRDEFVDLYL